MSVAGSSGPKGEWPYGPRASLARSQKTWAQGGCRGGGQRGTFHSLSSLRGERLWGPMALAAARTASLSVSQSMPAWGGNLKCLY